MLVAIVLGVLQGAVEWLPVSSEGVVTAVYGLVLDRPLGEAVRYALWLHLGTVPSVVVVFRHEIRDLVRDLITHPRRPTPLLLFVVVSTALSGVVGLPLLLSLEEFSSRAGAMAMALIGALMLVTGIVQLRRKTEGIRTRDTISPLDASLAGLAQGLAVLPGLSRSGMTVALLLARRVDRREALTLSFLMSVPANLGAALYIWLDGGQALSAEMVVATIVAFGVGLATIRALLAVAGRVNFGLFVLVVGVAILLGAVWQALG